MRTFFSMATALAVALLVWGLPVTGKAVDDKDDDMKRIQGTWSIHPDKYKHVGDKKAIEALIALSSAQRFMFDGNSVTFHTPPGKDQKGKFRLDPTKKPKNFDLSDTEQGIYELEGDTLKLCWDIEAKTNGRPTKFDLETQDKDTVKYLYLKREVPAAPSSGEKKDKFDPAGIVGKWMFTEGTQAGEKVEAKKVEGDVTFTFTKDTITIEGGGDKHVMKYKLDASKSPIQIDLEATEGVVAGSKGEGIIALDGKTMKFAYVTNIPDCKRPEKFESTKNNKASYLFVLKKAK